MFAPEDKETTLLPEEPAPPLEYHDVVFLSFDTVHDPFLRVAMTVRQSSEETFILLVSNSNCDLSKCFRPKIRPGGVLFRPLQNAELRDILEEVAAEIDRLAQNETEDVFIFKAEGVSRRVPLRDILFFEASNKKVILHTAGQEIVYYDSIENLSAQLPPHFIRCHRSYIVNTRRIESMRGAEMEVRLNGGYRIPFSRSYRDAVRQALVAT